jgi:hypothetical protein
LTKGLKTETELRIIIVFFILIALSTEEASASTTTYYFKNNGTSTDLGFDGTTNYTTATGSVTIPYKQVYTTSTTGTAYNIRYTTTSGTTVYNVYRFYPITNVTTYTRIEANITGRLSYRGPSTSGRVNVSIWDYNPADGSRTKYGESTNISSGGTTTTNYDFKTNNAAFNISSGHKLVVYVNITSASAGGTVRLYFGGLASYIVLSETPIPIAIIDNGNNITNNNSLSLSINQDTNVRFDLTANLTIDSMIITKGSNVSALGNDTPGKITMWSDLLFPNYGITFVNMTVFNTTTSASKNWTITVNDVIPPGQVTNLTNTTIPTSNSINLGWDVVNDNLGGSGIKDYLIDVMNNSINWLTVERPTINASNIKNGYEYDAYWYTFRNNVPVDCTQCHSSLGTKEFAIGNFWMKFNSTHLFIMAHVQDNDINTSDDYVGFGFDPEKNGGTSPQTDDRLYDLYENGTLYAFTGDGSDWVDTNTNASSSVKGAGAGANITYGAPRYEIAIPLSEIANPTNGSTVNFIFESDCTAGTDFQKRSTYLPAAGDDKNPSTWTTLTYRNVTQWDNIGTSPMNSFEATSLISNFRYNFSVRARDNALNIGDRSIPYTGQTADRMGYIIRGYITSAGLPINNADISTGGYIVHSDANGFYELSDLINGTYNLTADASGFMSNSSTSVTLNGADMFNVNITLQDLTAPFVISNTNNFIVSNGSFLILNASITDAYSGVNNATVNVSFVNSTINEAILSRSGGYWINTTIIADRGETVGILNLTITTYDNASNVNKIINMTAGIDDTAPVVTSNTNYLYVSNGSFLKLDASISDAFSGVNNATVNVSSVNSTINEALLTLSGDYWINNTIIVDKGENTGFNNLTITTYDNAGNVNNSINMTAWINPGLEIVDWRNNITNDQDLNITIFIEESIRFNVTANQNVSYNWSYDDTDQFINANNFSNQFSTSGLYFVNAIVSNSDSTVSKNWTINVVYKPDLVITPENIYFSYIPSEVENGEVKENVNVTINVTVYNSGLGDATNINMSFYDGSPGSANNIANATITNINTGESQDVTIYWNSIIGSHDILIKIDPENTIIETDDSNNNASKNINVSAWQKYYGNVSGNLSLRDSIGNSMTNWYWATPQGNIFISKNSSIDYSHLQALGRKKDGNVSLNNFAQADELLNMTPGSRNATGFFNNNLTMLFSSNGTTPRNYTNFTVYGRKIENVSIFNSTNTTNFNSVETSTFITGILWDTSKDNGDGDYGDDGEEIVFISGINVNNTGLGNSSHDYEIAIPSIIRSEGQVYFFVELK